MEKEVMVDPMMTIKEVVNLKELYEQCLGEAVVTMLNHIGRSPSRLDIFTVFPGYRGRTPDWIGHVVESISHPEYGKGTIKALRRVYNLFFAGVEFESPVKDGHSLELHHVGEKGIPGHCLWLPSKELKMPEEYYRKNGIIPCQ